MAQTIRICYVALNLLHHAHVPFLDYFLHPPNLQLYHYDVHMKPIPHTEELNTYNEYKRPTVRHEMCLLPLEYTYTIHQRILCTYSSQQGRASCILLTLVLYTLDSTITTMITLVNITSNNICLMNLYI